MQTTYSELQNLFKLRDNKMRQLKIALENKITCLPAGDVIATDPQLQQLLQGFREGGALSIEDVCEQYKVTIGEINRLIKDKMLPCYQLIAAKGSKTLFLKADIEKEKQNLLLIARNKHEYKRLGMLVSAMFAPIKDEFNFSDRGMDIFISAYFDKESLHSIAEKYDLSPFRVKQILDKTEPRILEVFRYICQERKLNIDYKAKYNELFAEHQELLKKLNSEHVDASETLHVLPPPEILNKKIRFADFTNRTTHCLLAGTNCDIIADLLKFNIQDFTKIRNFWKKCLWELVDFFKDHDITFHDNQWWHLSTPLSGIIEYNPKAYSFYKN